MILILCHPGDRVAVWLADRLAQATGRRTEIVTVDVLFAGSSFAFVHGDAGSDCRIDLSDGRVLDGGDLDLVVNRISAIPDTLFIHAADGDRDYARQEMHAVLAGWFAWLDCAVVNPAHPRALSGVWPGPVACRHLAAAAGLPVTVAFADALAAAPLPAYSAAPAIVHAGRLFGRDLAPGIAAASVRFAAAIGADILSLQFSDAPEPVFLGVDPVGDWRHGGQPLLEALAAIAP